MKNWECRLFPRQDSEPPDVGCYELDTANFSQRVIILPGADGMGGVASGGDIQIPAILPQFSQGRQKEPGMAYPLLKATRHEM